MSLDYTGHQDIFTLDDVPKSYLQVLLPAFTLQKEGARDQGRVIDITLTEQLPAIGNGTGKKQFFALVRTSPHGEQQLREDLEAFDTDQHMLARRFDCSSHPLRYGNGGVLPVIRWKRAADQVDEYVCLFYRDIFPIGWNIANGASDNLEEMKDPERILLREFGEELLIRDDEKGIIYTFDPGRDKDPGASPSKARKAWETTHPEITGYTTLSVPMTWIDGPDRVRVHWENGSYESGGYFLNIIPDDNAIEVDRVALITVTGKISFFDGEQSKGHTLNRAVGLFKVARFSEPDALHAHTFVPDLVFFDGAPGDPADLLHVVRKKIAELEQLPSPFRTREDQREWESSARQLDLCPITRRMVQRYLEKTHSAPATPSSPLVSAVKHDAGECQVFLSYRSTDESVARGLHDHLESNGLKTFLSAVSLPRLGESDYAAAIDRALESAKCLVVLGTHADSFDSGWVGYEWRSFLNEIRSGRKTECQLFTFVNGVTVDQLPYALRSCQMIPFSITSPQDAYESLTRYLRAQKEIPACFDLFACPPPLSSDLGI